MQSSSGIYITHYANITHFVTLVFHANRQCVQLRYTMLRNVTCTLCTVTLCTVAAQKYCVICMSRKYICQSAVNWQTAGIYLEQKILKDQNVTFIESHSVCVIIAHVGRQRVQFYEDDILALFLSSLETVECAHSTTNFCILCAMRGKTINILMKIDNELYNKYTGTGRLL
jgi:hypothetical protein